MSCQCCCVGCTCRRTSYPFPFLLGASCLPPSFPERPHLRARGRSYSVASIVGRLLFCGARLFSLASRAPRLSVSLVHISTSIQYQSNSSPLAPIVQATITPLFSPFCRKSQSQTPWFFLFSHGSFSLFRCWTWTPEAAAASDCPSSRTADQSRACAQLNTRRGSKTLPVFSLLVDYPPHPPPLPSASYPCHSPSKLLHGSTHIRPQLHGRQAPPPPPISLPSPWPRSSPSLDPHWASIQAAILAREKKYDVYYPALPCALHHRHPPRGHDQPPTTRGLPACLPACPGAFPLCPPAWVRASSRSHHPGGEFRDEHWADKVAGRRAPRDESAAALLSDNSASLILVYRGASSLVPRVQTNGTL